MKHLLRLRNLVSGMFLGVVLLLGSSGAVYATSTSAQSEQAKASAPPASNLVSGRQDKPLVAPGSRDAKSTQQLGGTAQVKTDASGKPQTAPKGLSPQTGYVSGVDFQTPYNYCWKNLVYTPVKNTTNYTQYIHVQLYNQGSYRDVYTSVAAGGVAYPAFYGVDGSYYAYLYVWNGSSYQYDEYMTGNNTCNVSVTRTYNYGGWVQLKIQNVGTAYATQVSSELAPYPAYGTYTGTQYDYPAAGGAAIYRWFYVGYYPYGITSYTYGSFNSPYMFSGDL